MDIYTKKEVAEHRLALIEYIAKRIRKIPICDIDFTVNINSYGLILRKDFIDMIAAKDAEALEKLAMELGDE